MGTSLYFVPSSSTRPEDGPIDSLISDLILRAGRGTTHWHHARDWAVDRLRMASELEEQADLAVRLRVALSLCPVDALTHRRAERISRLEKIERHLLEGALVPPEYVGQLADAVDRTLDAWQVQRENVTANREQLLARDGARCQCCAVDFDTESDKVGTVAMRDPFKLAWVDPVRHLAPTVDHREPVSKFGTNEIDNLWLFCRLCNEGKGDGAPLLLKHELEYAAALPWTAPAEPDNDLVAHSGRLVYRVLARHDFRCAECGGRESEITIRKERERGLAVLSNLTSICVECLASSKSDLGLLSPTV